MMLLVTLWWLFFFTAIGLCLGSFLNVVIYRLPREQSLREPLWSACPACDHRIHWYDNLPILSFLRLRGRCRHCAVPIATRYVVVEAAMALIVLLLIDAFFVAQVRDGLSRSAVGLTERLALDWPILLAHIGLFACLLSMSAIDLEHYWVDIRFTSLAAGFGFVMHALWTPKHAATWPRPSEPVSWMSLFVLAGLGMTWLFLWCRPDKEPMAEEEPDIGQDDSTVIENIPPSPEAPPAGELAEPGRAVDTPELAPWACPAPSRAWGWCFVVVLVGLLVAVAAADLHLGTAPYGVRALVPLGLLFAVIVREGAVHRESDLVILDALHQERTFARGMVLRELGLLLPSAALGIVGLLLVSGDGALATGLREALHTKIPVWGVTMMRAWAPLEGLATAASGFIIGGAIGWAVRIVFTLAFGKEAFGSGDVHLMAAAGCIAGWPVVVLGFMLTCALAMFGWLLMLPFKQSRALPLGPWLSLSFLIVTLFYDSILRLPLIERFLETWSLLFFQISQAGGGALFLGSG